MKEKTQYVCVMFPYPSGEGLHLGHWYNYAVMDSYCRWLRSKGTEVFQPFGYDAFGLPAENYARKIGGDPRQITNRNIENFRAEMQRMNTQYQEILVTSEESYYKITQWLFELLYSCGLAYKKVAPVNYCPSCQTVLANEQVKTDYSAGEIGSDCCERCGTEVEIKELDQWFLKITKYKDRLLEGLNNLDYPAGTIKRQRHWLNNLQDWCVSRQRKWGCPIPLEGETDTLDTFVDSSFYFLRYLNPADPFAIINPWQYKQVDLYVGGAEHACMHLVYARFIHYFLYDCGIVPIEEPFKKVVHQGMITNKSEKMSKSAGNAVDSSAYDPDELRMYLMFIGPYTEGGDWQDKGIVGITRFLNRCRTWLKGPYTEDGMELPLAMLQDDIDKNFAAFKFNKVISDLMTFLNEHRRTPISEQTAKKFAEILRLVAPGFTYENN